MADAPPPGGGGGGAGPAAEAAGVVAIRIKTLEPATYELEVPRTVRWGAVDGGAQRTPLPLPPAVA